MASTAPATNILNGYPIRNFDTSDPGATAWANDIKGGHHQVVSLAERDAITIERRQIGMTCWVSDTQLTYVLNGGITNADWEEDAGGGVSASQIELRDRMNGVYPTRRGYFLASVVDLNPRPLSGDQMTIPRSSGAFVASQSGFTVTANPIGSQSAFSANDAGRRIFFDDGTHAVITFVPYVANQPVLSVTVDRPQTVAAQGFRIQAKGVCALGDGDSVGYSCLTDLRGLMYQLCGYGGSFCSAASDTTIGDFEVVTLSGGVTVKNNAFDCAPAGLDWLMPVNGVVECGVSAKFGATVTDIDQVFGIPQRERVTDCVTVLWKRKAGATLRIEARLHENFSEGDGWILLADNVDTDAGAEYIAWREINHAAGPCWRYRVTLLTDTLGGGLELIGVYAENKANPGFVYVSWDTGGSKVTDYILIENSALKVLNWICRFDLHNYQSRDAVYNPNTGTWTGQVPNLPEVLPQYFEKWDSVCPRINTAMWGGYPGQNDLEYTESGLYRDIALARKYQFIDLGQIQQDYAEGQAYGVMGDTVHASAKGGRFFGTEGARQLGIFDIPWAREVKNIKSRIAEIEVLLMGGRDMRITIENSKAGPWANGVRMLSASGFTSWATVPAPGTGGFTIQLWLDLPLVNPASSIPLFGFYPTESAANVAGFVSSIIDTSGRFSISFRNAANDGTATYRLANFIQRYGGRRGCLTVVIDVTKPHPQVYFGAERSNDWCQPEYSATAGATVQRITDPINIMGGSFTLGISQIHCARACALWSGIVLSASEILNNADRGYVGAVGTTDPSAYWFASTGAGRRILDISGNGRHLLLGANTPNRNNPGDGSTTGFGWLVPTGVRTTHVMTSNAGMIPLPGEDVVVNITAGTLGTMTLPANPDLSAPEINIIGMSSGGWRVSQGGASTQIVTGAGASDGADRTTAGPTGYVQSGARYSRMALKAVTSDLWITPGFPAGATVAVASNTAASTEAPNVTGARMASMLRGGIQSSGSPYSAWSVIPALGTGGFTLAWTGLVPAVAPVSTVAIARTSSNRSTSAIGGSLDVGFNTNGRLTVAARTADNLSSRSWQLSNFISAYGGRLVRITVRFNPASPDPEVWVEDAKVSGTGTLTWVVQDVGTPPTMATADFSGTNCMVGCDSPCYQFALWAGVLADAQILENQRNGAAVGATAPLVYYTFQEGEGRTSVDLSGNGRTLTFLNTGGSSGNDPGNGITTGVRWLRKRRSSTFTATANQALSLRPGERCLTNAPSVRVPCTLDPLAELDGRDIVLENIGAAGFLLTLPTGHKAVMGAGSTVGTDATSSGGTLTSNLLYAAVTLRPLIVNSTTDVTWMIVRISGVTLA